MTDSDATILVVDDDAELRSVLRNGLTAEGWTVIEAATREDMLAAIDAETIDVVALDMTLGAEEGLALAHLLRQHSNLPVLMMIGHDEPYDRLQGLEAGADDYLFKPFQVKEMVLRICRILERYRREIAPDLTVTFDHSNFDMRRRVVRHNDGDMVPLTSLELKLLDLFVRHPGRVLSRDEISQHLHGREWTPYDRTIDTHVARLRRKIEPAEGGPSLIRSVRGVGYVFTGDVTPAAVIG